MRLILFIQLLLSICLAPTLNAQEIFSVRNVCVGDIITLKLADFPCTNPNATLAEIKVELLGEKPPQIGTFPNVNVEFQFNRIGTGYATLVCNDNRVFQIQYNVRDCDTPACFGPNLVPNPSLDNLINCDPARTTLTNEAADWLDYPAPTGRGRCQVLNTLCPISIGPFPFRDRNNIRTGNGSMGFIVDNGISSNPTFDNSQYAGVPLTQTLIVGKRYKVRFFAKSTLATYTQLNPVFSSIGAGFTVGNPQNAFRLNPQSRNPSNYTYFGDAPKVVDSRGQYIKNFVLWAKIEGVFTADKPYTHLLVGKLNSNIFISLDYSNPAYYYFDDFSVQALNDKIELERADTLVCKGSTASIKLKNPVFDVNQQNVTTGQNIRLDSLLRLDNQRVTSTTCYKITAQKCPDSLFFCFRNRPDYDTTIRRFSCLPRDTGVIVKQLRTINGCDSLVRVRTELRLKDTTSGVQLVCNIRDTGLVLLKFQNTEGCDSFVLTQRFWRKPDTTTLSVTTCFPKDTGLVVRQLLNRFGCDSVILTRTNLIKPIDIQLGADTTVAEGTRFRLRPILSSDSVRSFSWQPPTNLSCADCRSPEVIALQTVNYKLTVLSKEGGCMSQKERLVRVENKPFLFVPTAFSPNNDGKNETLTVYANSERVKQIRRFSVYNRWGNLLFDRRNFAPNDEKLGWDGTYLGRLLDNDIFVYVVEFALFNDDIRIVSGDTTLIR